MLASVSAAPVGAYESELHQQLTFLAAKQFNECVTELPVAPVSALEVRYIAKANASQADTNVFVRMFRWTYYDRARDVPGVVSDDSLLWVVDTRLHDHFDELAREFEDNDDGPGRYQVLGRILGYIQDVTSPAHAVPVYTGRWWRLSMGDRFDEYPIDADAVAAAVEDSCDDVFASDRDFETILRDAAQGTLAAVAEPLFGLAVTWQAFWTLADSPDGFGEYGPAGNNFGRATDFRCGEVRCVLLDRDPLYREFALQRHVAAVIASMRALMRLHTGPVAARR
jgi:hypothetical protein